MLREQFNTLILQPVLRVHEKAPFDFLKVIVLDALDECKSHDLEAILWTFRDAGLAKDTLRLFVMSRLDIQVLRGFEGLLSNVYQDIVLQNIPEETTKSNLHIYFTHKLRVIRESHNNTVASARERLSVGWPGRKEISILVDMAVPLFIFAATTCRFLGDPRHLPNDQLATILRYRTASQKLHKTYLPVLDQLVGDDSDGQQDIVLRRFERIVGAIILLFEPLSAVHLAAVLNIRLDEVRVQVNLLHSVLQVPRDDLPIRLLHLSFRDFLTDNTTRAETAFWVDKRKRHLSLADQCLERMGATSGLGQDICGLDSPGVLAKEVDPEVLNKRIPEDLRYACLYWVSHLVEGDGSILDKDTVYRFLRKHFLHWIEVLSLLGSLHKATSYIQALQSLVVSGTRGKQISAFLYDARRFLLYNFTVIEEAPLQAYSSALIFSPNKSLIRKAFRNCIPNWITGLPNVAENWSAVEQAFDPIPGRQYLNLPVFSPDGTKLASGPQIWDVTSGQTISTLNNGHQWPVMFLSNHEQIFVDRSQLTVKNIGTGQITSIPSPGNCTRIISTTRNGPRLVVLRSARPTKRNTTGLTLRFYDLLVYNIDTRKVLLHTQYWLNAHGRIIFSSDGRRMALIGGIVVDGKKAPLSTDTEPPINSDWTVRLEVWDLGYEMPRVFLRDYEDIEYTAVSDFSADGSKIAVRLAGPRVLVIDVNGDLADKTLDCSDSDGIDCLAFSPRENTLAIGSDFKICLWNFDADEVNPILENEKCGSMVFSPDGLKLAFKTEGGLIKVYDVRTDLVSASHERAYNGSAADSVVFSPCGTMVASSPDYGSHVSIWNVSKRKVMNTDMARATEDENLFVGFLDSKQLFVVLKHSLEVWSIRSSQLVHAYTTNVTEFRSCLAFSKGGSKLARYQYPYTLHIVDARSGQNLVSRRLKADREVISAKFSKDGSNLAVGIRRDSAAMVVELRETKPLRLKKKWTCSEDQVVGQVAFSANDRFILFNAAAPYTTVGDPSTERTFVAQTSTMTEQRAFISKDCRWVLGPKGARMFYLPPELRPHGPRFKGMIPPSASAHKNTVALGSETGHVTIIDFNFSGFEE